MNRPRPRIQRLQATHLKLIERARSNQGNTVDQIYRLLEDLTKQNFTTYS